jgi:hypothetical protein
VRKAVREALRALASEGRVDTTLRSLIEALGAGIEEPEEVEVIVSRLNAIGVRIMTVISDFAATVQSHFDSVATSIDGLSGDVQGLKDMIETLQNTPGAITPEDQALLDQIQSRAEEIASRIVTLDAMTPPAPPAEPPVEPPVS